MGILFLSLVLTGCISEANAPYSKFPEVNKMCQTVKDENGTLHCSCHFGLDDWEAGFLIFKNKTPNASKCEDFQLEHEVEVVNGSWCSFDDSKCFERLRK